MKIGVLALQGAFREHAALLRRCGAEPSEIRLPEELAGVDGLVVPGGESTTMWKLIVLYGFEKPLLDLAGMDIPFFGTCAGAILLAGRHNDSETEALGIIDISVSRNAYGRQIDSRETNITLSFSPQEPFNALFIRAPVIDETGPDVTVLARYRGKPVLVRQDTVLAATFHPELTEDERIHRYFLGMCTAAAISRTRAVPAPCPSFSHSVIP
ncbi:MAG TPA: pyridoxal 5'-phosphate synthase glutaminase subunit PdxT [Deltaproteobacteria bacterium]|nr:pyridoxal 5'-phosphate synthase glutaminase subunit PdxT [Deltaproteobacteria bacterium]